VCLIILLITNRIATKLRRQIATLKRDQVLKAASGYSFKVEDELDKLIEDNFRLTEEEKELKKQYKKLNK
jgi:hypothetical protein